MLCWSALWLLIGLGDLCMYVSSGLFFSKRLGCPGGTYAHLYSEYLNWGDSGD